MYSLFPKESSHIFSTGISNMFREYFLIYILSAPSAAGRRTSLFRVHNLLLTAVDEDSWAQTIPVDFFKEDVLGSLSALYTNNVTEVVPKGEHFDQLHFMFSFVAAFVYRIEREQQYHPMTHLHTRFSELPHPLHCRHLRWVLALYYFSTAQHRSQNFKALLRDLFDAYGETGLFNLKVNLLDRLVEHLYYFGRSELLCSQL